MFKRTVLITPSSSVFERIGVYAPIWHVEQWYGKTFVVKDFRAEPVQPVLLTSVCSQSNHTLADNQQSATPERAWTCPRMLEALPVYG